MLGESLGVQVRNLERGHMTEYENKVDSGPRNPTLHRRIKSMLMRRYDMPVIDNVYRSDYVECLVACTLGTDWWLTWTRGWDWAPWDCQHISGGRLEVKQSAARQPWDRKARARRRSPRFDIAPRTGYWTPDGDWVPFPGRLADIYVFAWHDESQDGYCDQRDANQWIFFVVAEKDLPEDRKGIGLTGLKAIVPPCRITDLKRAVENALPARGALKATLGRV